VYDDAGAAADEVVRTIATDLDDDHAVLLCVSAPIAARVEQHVDRHTRLELLDRSDRYTRPIDALHVLWRFTRDQLDAGASRVHSIGELRFTGAASDADWLWYESACNDVLDGLALTATCLYDTRTCPDAALATVHATHDVIGFDGAALPVDRAAPPAVLQPPPLPERRADVELTGLSVSHPVREVLRRAGSLDAGVVARANLVFSELIANAARHGDGAAAVELWFDDGAVVGRVTDHGRGIDDPFATMRTPELGERGVGLWLSNIEATRLVVEPHRSNGTQVIALVAPR
jgi:anti-sigma regulatory factor (Ser/Thr protein kinase)